MTPAEALKQYWGYDEFRPLQLDIIESLLSGRDTIGLLPTGGGKSLTFQIPALLFDGITVVVSPLVSLMKDQVDNLFDRGIRAVYFHSGLTRRESRLALDRCRLEKVKLAYVSPEKLKQKNFIDELRRWNVSAIVVDEAHCISQWGYDFRPSYLSIKSLRELFPAAPVLALTASATPDVVADIADKLSMRDHALFARSFARDNISYIVRHDENKEGMMMRVLTNTAGTAIVYVRSRRRSRELADAISAVGISAAYYHAGLSPEEKADRQDRWKNGEVRVMVATNAFGMGIDKADVRQVIHYDIPSSLEEYYQEAGRAGRDGKHSYAVLLVAKSDKALLTRRLSEAFPPKDYILRVYELLGNFLDIAVGEGFDNVYSCDFDRFCLTYKLQPAIVRNSLSILTRAGYIEYSDESLTLSRIMILIDKREFYNLDLDPKTERIFQGILRIYPGLFSDYVRISEQRIASTMSVSEADVSEALIQLSRMHVIHFIPRRMTPYVYYPVRREEPRHIVIPRSVYDDRKARCKARLDAIRRFAFADDRCRVQTMLEYFGEKDCPECGTCDVCRNRRHTSPSPDKASAIESQIVEYINAYRRIPVDRLIAMFPSQRKLAAEILRTLCDKGDVKIDGNFVFI